MAGRVSPSGVEDIFDTELETEQLQVWIEIANELVDDISDADSSIDGTRLSKIEKLLAAHFASAQDPRIAEDSVGGSSITYQVDVGEGLRSTVYGQQAIALDSSGTLGQATKTRASISDLNARNIDRPDRD